MTRNRFILLMLFASGAFTLWTHWWPTQIGGCPRFSAEPKYRFAMGIIFIDGAFEFQFRRQFLKDLPPGYKLMSVPIPYRFQPPIHYNPVTKVFTGQSYWMPRMVFDKQELEFPMSATPGLVRPQYSNTVINVPVWLIDIALILLLWRPFRKLPAEKCVKCHYDLRGSLDSAVCPECGSAISAEQKERIRDTLRGG